MKPSNPIPFIALVALVTLVACATSILACSSGDGLATRTTAGTDARVDAVTAETGPMRDASGSDVARGRDTGSVLDAAALADASDATGVDATVLDATVLDASALDATDANDASVVPDVVRPLDGPSDAPPDVCAPQCVGRQCGDDGCGGSCGSCTGQVACSANGACVCVPQCSGKQCGPDGCGGTCGSCDPYLGTTCSAAGECGCAGATCPVVQSTPPGSGNACEPHEGAACGACPPSCGLPTYPWTCADDLPPPGATCTHVGYQSYCCADAQCVSAPGFVANCHNVGLPSGSAFTCWHGATPSQAGCVNDPSSTIYCCP